MPCPQRKDSAESHLARIAAAEGCVRREPGTRGGREARQRDHARHRASAKRPGAAATHDGGAANGVCWNSRKGDEAEKSIRLWHAIQQQQGAAGRITANRPQGDALCRHIGRPAIRPAELLETGHAGQRFLYPARRGAPDHLAIEQFNAIGPGAWGRRQGGHNDGVNGVIWRCDIRCWAKRGREDRGIGVNGR